MRTQGKGFSEILAIINRLKIPVLPPSCKYKAKRRSGRPHVENILDDHLIQRLTSTQQMSTYEVQRSSGLSASKNTIRRWIVEKETIVYSKMKKKPAQKPHHKLQRML